MRLYLTTADLKTGEMGRWAGTQDDARVIRREYKAAGYENIGTNTVEVPTHKTELIDFLNKHKIIVPGVE